MTTVENATPRFAMGQTIIRALQVVRRNVTTLLCLALVPAFPGTAMYWAQIHLPIRGLTTDPSIIAVRIGLFLVWYVSTLIFHAAAVQITLRDFEGRRANVTECLAVGLNNIYAVILLSLMVAIGVVLGLFFVLVGAFYVMVAVSVVVPARVVERRSVSETIDRSIELTRGYGWPIFGLLIASYVFSFASGAALGAVIGLIFEIFALPLDIMIVAAQTISVLLFGMFYAVGIAVIYFELRSLKEGFRPETLISVFD